MSSFYLQGHGYDLEKTYSESRKQFDQQIAHVSGDDAAAMSWFQVGVVYAHLGQTITRLTLSSLLLCRTLLSNGRCDRIKLNVRA